MLKTVPKIIHQKIRVGFCLYIIMSYSSYFRYVCVCFHIFVLVLMYPKSTCRVDMNGLDVNEGERSSGNIQICCLIDCNYRCNRPAGNASYSKRIQKTVQHRRLRLVRDDSVCLRLFYPRFV